MPRPLLSSLSVVRRSINVCIDSPPKEIQFWLHSKDTVLQSPNDCQIIGSGPEQQEIYRTKIETG